MPETGPPPGVTFDRAGWLALVAEIGDHPLIAALEAERLAAEFTPEERTAYAAAGEGFGWLCGSDEFGWFPRYPGRHTRAGPKGDSIIVDPPRRSLGIGRHGEAIEVIVTDPVPAAGVHGLVRRGIIRELEPMAEGVLGGIATLNAAPSPWRVAPDGTDSPLTGAWVLDARRQRIAWVPDATNAHGIVRDVNAARATEADTYRIGALRDALSRLQQVTHPDDRYQPPPELTRRHEEAKAAVERLLAALPAWAGVTEKMPPAAPGQAADAAPGPIAAPPDQPPAPPRRPSFRLATFALGVLLGWLLRDYW